VKCRSHLGFPQRRHPDLQKFPSLSTWDLGHQSPPPLNTEGSPDWILNWVAAVDLGELAVVVVDKASPAEVAMEGGLLRKEVGVEWVVAAGMGVAGSSAQGHGPAQPDAAMPLTSMAHLPGGSRGW
jgi:hypothetical protein